MKNSKFKNRQHLSAGKPRSMSGVFHSMSGELLHSFARRSFLGAAEHFVVTGFSCLQIVINCPAGGLIGVAEAVAVVVAASAAGRGARRTGG